MSSPGHLSVARRVFALRRLSVAGLLRAGLGAGSARAAAGRPRRSRKRVLKGPIERLEERIAIGETILAGLGYMSLTPLL